MNRNMKIGRQLYNARLAADLSQNDLGKMLHMNDWHISQIEKGRVFPRLNTLQRYAAALGLQVTLQPAETGEVTEDEHW